MAQNFLLIPTRPVFESDVLSVSRLEIGTSYRTKSGFYVSFYPEPIAIHRPKKALYVTLRYRIKYFVASKSRPA